MIYFRLCFDYRILHREYLFKGHLRALNQRLFALLMKLNLRLHIPQINLTRVLQLPIVHVNKVLKRISDLIVGPLRLWIPNMGCFIVYALGNHLIFNSEGVALSFDFGGHWLSVTPNSAHGFPGRDSFKVFGKTTPAKIGLKTFNRTLGSN